MACIVMAVETGTPEWRIGLTIDYYYVSPSAEAVGGTWVLAASKANEAERTIQRTFVCRHVCRHVYRHVCGNVYIHVDMHVYGHVHRHLCWHVHMHVYRHPNRNVYTHLCRLGSVDMLWQREIRSSTRPRVPFPAAQSRPT